MLHFFIKDNGKLFVFKGDLPEEPSPIYPIESASKYYQEALQRAKKDAVEVDNQMAVHAMVLKTYNEAKVDTIYSLEGCEMEIKKDRIKEFGKCPNHHHRFDGLCNCLHDFALITFSEKKEDKPTPEQQKEEETQENWQARLVDEYFRSLRLNHNHHLGMGDIRLTFGQQEELIQLLIKGVKQSLGEE